MLPAGVRKGGALLLYSYMDNRERMEVGDYDVMRGVRVRGWPFCSWLAELDEQTLRAAMKARAHAHAHWCNKWAGLLVSAILG